MKRTNTAKWIDSANRWQINVQKDGVRKTFTSAKPGRTGQREANKKADAWLENGIGTKRTKVAEVWEEFLQKRRLTSEKEYTSCEMFGRLYLLPAIGSKNILSVTEQDYQDIIDTAFRHPASGKKELSRKTLQGFCSIERQFTKFCRRSQLSTLELEDLHVPSSSRKIGKTVLSVQDLKTLFTVDTTIRYDMRVPDPCINCYRFQILTGVRPGEMRGLVWSDIEGNQCRIRCSINIRGQVTRGKNENAIRSFVLSPAAMTVLESQKALNLPGKHIFPIPSEDYYYRHWKRYQEANGLPGISLYEMRHTFVSIAKSLPEGQLKSIVGHSKDMDTYGIYSHYISGDDEKIAENLQNVFDALLN